MSAGPLAVSTAERPVRLRHRIEDALVRLAALGVGPLPMAAVRACGRAIGLAVYAADGSHRRVALENLAHAFPERAARERRRIARATFAHFGSVLLELLKIDDLPPGALMRAVEMEGFEHARAASARGRGVLYVTGHFGCWEVQAIVHAICMAPVSVLARPLDNPLLHARLERIRTQTGNAVIYRHGALRKVLRELEAGRGIAILIDQHLLTSDAVAVDFFGRPAATTAALAAIAARTQAPVLPVFAWPLPHGRYRLVYERALDPPRDESPESIQAFTQRCTSILEAYIRRQPDLWLWMHQRWRTSNAER